MCARVCARCYFSECCVLFWFSVGWGYRCSGSFLSYDVRDVLVFLFVGVVFFIVF